MPKCFEDTRVKDRASFYEYPLMDCHEKLIETVLQTSKMKFHIVFFKNRQL